MFSNRMNIAEHTGHGVDVSSKVDKGVWLSHTMKNAHL